MSWNHLEKQPSKRPHNAFNLLTLKCLNTFINRFKDWKNSRLQNVFTPTSSYATWRRLNGVFKTLEMLLSKRFHNAFKWLKWKCFIDVQNVFSRLKTHRLQNVFISTSSHRIWSCLQSVKIFQLNVSKTSLWCLQTINVLETSSSGLWNIWNFNFKHSVKYWIRLEHGFKYAALQRTPWRLVRVPAGWNHARKISQWHF